MRPRWAPSTSWSTTPPTRARGVERFYVWFADFAPPETLARFGEVMEAVACS